jgi:LacI family transcriptional regulator
LHFIRRHACSGIRVRAVLDEVPLSRRSLEQRFQKLLGRSPKAEILRVQIERAQWLLAETDLPVAAVSRKAGFSQPAYFSAAFRQRTGVTPSAFRRQAAAL